MAKSPIFDTSVFSPFKQQIERQISSALFPSIVFYELTTTSVDEGTLKKYELWRLTLNKIDRVLTPTANDWWETAKAIRRLYLKKNRSNQQIEDIAERRPNFTPSGKERRFCGYYGY